MEIPQNDEENNKNFDENTDQDFQENNQNLNNDNNENNENNDKNERIKSNLITLKYISVCQCCKNNFDTNDHLPYLLLCEHFFCRNCIESFFTDENGIISCPEDGQVASSIEDLKILKNLIISEGKQKNSIVDNSSDDILKKTLVEFINFSGKLLFDA